MTSFLRTSRAWAVAAAMTLTVVATMAQPAAYPNKPVHVIVGYAPGGVGDIMARLVSQPVSESLGQPFVVENRPGANAGLAADFVAKSKADGYTICLCSTVIESVNPYLFSKVPFDAEKDLVPVASTGSVPVFLAVRGSLPVTDMKSFVEYARARKPPLTYGSAGSGSTPHLTAELFKLTAGFEATHVPYRGAAPALQDLLGEQLDFVFDPGLAMPHLKSGKVRLLGVASARRSPLVPDVPTLEELGYKDMSWDTYFAYYAPAGTPPEIVLKLNQEVAKALALPSVQARLRDLGGDGTPRTPSDLKQIAMHEAGVYGPLIKKYGIKND